MNTNIFDQLYKATKKIVIDWDEDDVKTWLNLIGLSELLFKFCKFFYDFMTLKI